MENNKPDPIITVITPTYNHELYIAECIESVIAQTMTDWEMIIVDDGSTDKTPEIAKRYKDDRIRYIRNEHKGIEFLFENHNLALELSKGEFITVLEGDDFWPECRLERQLPAFEDKDIILSHGFSAYVDEGKIIQYPYLFSEIERDNYPVGSALEAFLLGANHINSQSVMLRKSVLLEIGGFTQPSYLPLVDYPTWMKLALKGKFKFIPEVLGYWRRHQSSITMNEGELMFNGFIKYCDEFADLYGEELRKLDLAEIIDNRGALAYLSLSLIMLEKKDWKEALKVAQKSWRRKTPVNRAFKVRILIVLIGAYLHFDIPGFFIEIRKSLYRR